MDMRTFSLGIATMIAATKAIDATPLSDTHNLSHQERSGSLQTVMEQIKNKVKIRGHLPYASVDQQLELIDSLAEFDLGRWFLSQNGGLNGYWTYYIVIHPYTGRITGLDHRNETFHPLESFILDRAPVALATQQRFDIFKEEAQKRLYSGCSFASIPCGLMGDLLELDFSQVSDFTLTGIDLDLDAIHQAEQLSIEKEVRTHCRFHQKNAWDLQIQEEFDLIATNGLTIYEPDDEKVIELYRQFLIALKPGGSLMASFLTFPPLPNVKTEWVMEKVNPQDALLQKIIFADILESRWQSYRSEEKTRTLLRKAG